MPFVFKGNPETNRHLWSLSYFLQNSSSSISEVKMGDIDEQLKINIRSILNTIPEETINGIIHAVRYAGLESLSDLQFVQEEDLILVLKPIQRRKLIKAWSEQNIPAVTLLSNLPLQNCKWKRENSLVLLQVYAKYKPELASPDIEKHEVWRKIADEIKEKCSLNCNELQCMDEIEKLRQEYETLKKKNSVNKQNTAFFCEAENAFENIKNSVISPAGTSNNLSVQKCKWKRKRCLKLLEVCAKYKTELSCPDVKEPTVWKKIADELRKSISLKCDELDCRNKIDELKCEYERIKNKSVTSRTVAIFLDEARKVFETIKTPINISAEQPSNTALLNCRSLKRRPEFHRRLLEVYAKYKNELSCSGLEEEEVWEKIAKEIRERYSYNCGASLCRFDLYKLKSQYESLKKGCSKNMTIYSKNFLDDVREAFETSENLDILNSQVNETKKVGKYVPPHLRNGRNQSESVFISKTEDKPFTIKVSNLSKDIKESDIRELFIPYGPIARIYTIKDALGQSKGFAFIKFHKSEDATQAIETINGIEYNKLILKVEWAQKTEKETIDHDFPMESIKVTNQVPSLPPFHNSKPSKFNMNDFKKVYSNEHKSVSIKYFWDNFDAENYSIWFCEYLYPDELTLTFMSCNLIEGMFQRLYPMHKNVFASVCLFGEDNNSTISGIWVWRGHELAFTLSPDWQVDYESYSWKKLDSSSEETKKLVNEYFAWSGEFGGKKFNQGKIFK